MENFKINWDINKCIDRIVFCCLITNLFLFSGCVDQHRVDKIGKIVQHHVEVGNLHGTVLVADRGTPIYQKAFGLANLEWRIPNAIDTRYRIYSMSKQFTAMIIMQLVEGGTLSLHEPISTYLPTYRKDVGDQITIHHLLTHTHGIPDNYDSLPQHLLTDRTEKLIENYFSNDLVSKPGTDWKYSGITGYMLLGAIIESVTGLSYGEVVQHNILDPVGMANTCYLDFKTPISKRAADYTREDGQIIDRIQVNFAHGNGASGLVSTVEDLLLWDQSLYTNKLLSQEYLEMYLAPQVTRYEPFYYGYGWYMADIAFNGDSNRVHFHSGGGSGFIFRDITDQQTIILLNNLSSDSLYNIGLELLTAVSLLILSDFSSKKLRCTFYS